MREEELKAFSKEWGLRGYSKLGKDELITLLRNNQPTPALRPRPPAPAQHPTRPPPPPPASPSVMFRPDRPRQPELLRRLNKRFGISRSDRQTNSQEMVYSNDRK